jgi:hypothetical protein
MGHPWDANESTPGGSWPDPPGARGQGLPIAAEMSALCFARDDWGTDDV